ncbi:conserved hypothetical protein [Gloeothece citriformis PCC 7424]|uniref:ATP-dependent Zn protease n=1 Tax=Gloeothece citriformis (strain PCC 7424) TaxID=65393 RepID=B7KLK9_GLOC7|nr:hypothetical protein [Gloeothece citriformis]ACK72581.1 conserved hypothetical protein [Gloeothece citriformis PCC 7424]
MEQTALNVIAISIFIMTLSALLGPLFHISPFIPAVATLSVLGLTTLDGLAFNSRGITVLLDLLSGEQHRQRIIHHEAGHFLVAYLLGIPVTGYTLSAWEAVQQKQSGLGGVIFDSTALTEKTLTPTEMPLMIERFCTVWMAGIAAETLIYGESQGGEEDRFQVRSALKLAGLPQFNYEQKERWALLQAKNLLEKHQSSYEALVKAMEQRVSVEECYQILGTNS